MSPVLMQPMAEATISLLRQSSILGIPMEDRTCHHPAYRRSSSGSDAFEKVRQRRIVLWTKRG